MTANTRRARARNVPPATIAPTGAATIPVQQTATAIIPPAAPTVPADEFDAMLANVAKHESSIRNALKQIDLGGYQEGCNASQWLGATWSGLAKLVTKPLNFSGTELHESEQKMRSILDRADPLTSELYSAEVAELNRLAVAASTHDTFLAARKKHDKVPTPTGKAKVDTVLTDEQRAEALAKLTAERDRLAAENNSLLREHADDCLAAIDSVEAIVKLTKSLRSTRQKGANRRATFIMLNLIRPTLEANSEEGDRGSKYVVWATKAYSIYKDYMSAQAKADVKVVDPAKLEEHVLREFEDYLQTEYGDKLGDDKKVLSAGELIDRIYDAVKRAQTRGAFSAEAREKIEEAMAAQGVRHSKDKAATTTNDGGSATKTAQTRARKGAPTEPTVEAPVVEQPVVPPARQRKGAPTGAAVNALAPDAAAMLQALAGTMGFVVTKA